MFKQSNQKKIVFVDENYGYGVVSPGVVEYCGSMVPAVSVFDLGLSSAIADALHEFMSKQTVVPVLDESFTSGSNVVVIDEKCRVLPQLRQWLAQMQFSPGTTGKRVLFETDTLDVPIPVDTPKHLSEQESRYLRSLVEQYFLQQGKPMEITRFVSLQTCRGMGSTPFILTRLRSKRLTEDLSKDYTQDTLKSMYGVSDPALLSGTVVQSWYAPVINRIVGMLGRWITCEYALLITGIGDWVPAKPIFCEEKLVKTTRLKLEKLVNERTGNPLLMEVSFLWEIGVVNGMQRVFRCLSPLGAMFGSLTTWGQDGGIVRGISNTASLMMLAQRVHPLATSLSIVVSGLDNKDLTMVDSVKSAYNALTESVVGSFMRNKVIAASSKLSSGSVIHVIEAARSGKVPVEEVKEAVQKDMELSGPPEEVDKVKKDVEDKVLETLQPIVDVGKQDTGKDAKYTSMVERVKKYKETYYQWLQDFQERFKRGEQCRMRLDRNDITIDISTAQQILREGLSNLENVSQLDSKVKLLWNDFNNTVAEISTQSKKEIATLQQEIAMLQQEYDKQVQNSSDSSKLKDLSKLMGALSQKVSRIEYLLKQRITTLRAKAQAEEQQLRAVPSVNADFQNLIQSFGSDERGVETALRQLDDLKRRGVQQVWDTPENAQFESADEADELADLFMNETARKQVADSSGETYAPLGAPVADDDLLKYMVDEEKKVREVEEVEVLVDTVFHVDGVDFHAMLPTMQRDDATVVSVNDLSKEQRESIGLRGEGKAPMRESCALVEALDAAVASGWSSKNSSWKDIVLSLKGTKADLSDAGEKEVNAALLSVATKFLQPHLNVRREIPAGRLLVLTSMNGKRIKSPEVLPPGIARYTAIQIYKISVDKGNFATAEAEFTWNFEYSMTPANYPHIKGMSGIGKDDLAKATYVPLSIAATTPLLFALCLVLSEKEFADFKDSLLRCFQNAALLLSLASELFKEVDSPTISSDFVAITGHSVQTHQPNTWNAGLLNLLRKFGALRDYSLLFQPVGPAIFGESVGTTHLDADVVKLFEDGNEVEFAFVPHVSLLQRMNEDLPCFPADALDGSILVEFAFAMPVDKGRLTIVADKLTQSGAAFGMRVQGDKVHFNIPCNMQKGGEYSAAFESRLGHTVSTLESFLSQNATYTLLDSSDEISGSNSCLSEQASVQFVNQVPALSFTRKVCTLSEAELPNDFWRFGEPVVALCEVGNYLLFARQNGVKVYHGVAIGATPSRMIREYIPKVLKERAVR